MNQEEFAKHVGVTKKRISAAIASGVITAGSYKITGTGRGGHKQYDIDPVRGKTDWDNNRDTSRIPDQDKAEVTREMNAASNDPIAEKKSSYATAKAVRETFAARMAQLDYEERSGKLVNVAQVKASAFNRARMVRNEILNVPGKISMTLAHMTDAHEIEMYLLQFLSKALEELSNGETVTNDR